MTTQTNAARSNKTLQKSNQQKNTVRFVLATAATIATLFGAQTLAFAGKTDTAAVEQAQTTAVAVVATPITRTTDDTQVTTNQSAQTTTTTIMTAASQPNPRSQSSR